MEPLKIALYEVACNHFRIKGARHSRKSSVRSPSYMNLGFITWVYRLNEVQDTNMVNDLYGRATCERIRGKVVCWKISIAQWYDHISKCSNTIAVNR